MFTIEKIKTAHSKVKSGSDFPEYVQDLIELGVKSYETQVVDGNTVYVGNDGFKLESGAKYPKMEIAEKGNAEQFIKNLKAHQQGKTDYPTFCKDCASSGIEKWVVLLDKMTCTYFDKTGKTMLVEAMPNLKK